MKSKTRPNNKNSETHSRGAPFIMWPSSAKGNEAFGGLTNNDPTAAFIFNIGSAFDGSKISRPLDPPDADPPEEGDSLHKVC